MYSDFSCSNEKDVSMKKHHKPEVLVMLTKRFLLENPDKVKREIQIYLMSQRYSKELASSWASSLYGWAKKAVDASFAFGPFYLLETEGPQWQARLFVNGMTAVFRCGITDDEHQKVYVVADIIHDRRNGVMDPLAH